MFNTTSNSSNTRINITQGTPGLIQKAHVKSFFARFAITSVMAKEIFVDKPKYEDKPVVVLQVMSLAETWLLAELIFQTDFDEAINPKQAS